MVQLYLQVEAALVAWLVTLVARLAALVASGMHVGHIPGCIRENPGYVPDDPGAQRINRFSEGMIVHIGTRSLKSNLFGGIGATSPLTIRWPRCHECMLGTRSLAAVVFFRMRPACEADQLKGSIAILICTAVPKKEVKMIKHFVSFIIDRGNRDRPYGEGLRANLPHQTGRSPIDCKFGDPTFRKGEGCSQTSIAK
jgi:hypothetical protein